MKFWPGRRAPVSEQHVLDVRERQRPLQQRIVVEIDLADRQIVGGAPVGIHLMHELGETVVCALQAPNPLPRVNVLELF